MPQVSSLHYSHSMIAIVTLRLGGPGLVHGEQQQQHRSLTLSAFEIGTAEQSMSSATDLESGRYLPRQ